MKNERILDYIKCPSFVVPSYLFKKRDKITNSLDEFIILCYFMNIGNKFIFNPEKIANDLNYSIEEVMIKIDSLSTKHLISVDVIKDDKGIMEEYIILDLLYDKIKNILIEDINENSSETSKDIYLKIEESFGRPISSIEYEIIKSWFENGFSEELVLEALKEAVFNGVSNLRYIDSILYEWSKRGIKTVQDVEKSRINHRNEKQSKEKMELFDYDWFDEE